VVHLEDLVPDGYEGWLGQAHDGERLVPALWNGRPFLQPPHESDLDVRSRLADGILQLPDRERRVVQLCFDEGKKLTHAAQEMKIRLPLASRLRKRALRRLHHAIGEGRKRLPESAVGRGLAP
jgi:DNA-directed RNA polymerase specialized sigma24 family protein